MGHVSYSFTEFSRNDRTPVCFTLCVYFSRDERGRERKKDGGWRVGGRERALCMGSRKCQARHFHPHQSTVSWFTQDAQQAWAERSRLTDWKVKSQGAQVVPDQGL